MDRVNFFFVWVIKQKYQLYPFMSITEIRRIISNNYFTVTDIFFYTMGDLLY
jgi:hypothetical protein